MLLRRMVEEKDRKRTDIEGLKHKVKNLERNLAAIKDRLEDCQAEKEYSPKPHCSIPAKARLYA